ncbi:MAG: glycosyltransferase family 2 protein [Hyphomonadaceae bacterium]|nr:glycosyltransferase family 2 protein [Hyphomonadaceae bacterium]
MRKSQERQGHAPRARKNRKAPQNPGKLLNVTEDIDLAYRLACRGWTSGVIAPPTYEEAPVTLGAWLKQRTRWIKGHLHTWLILMRNPIRTAQELGLTGFLTMQMVLGGGLAASFLHAPLAMAVLWAAVSPTNLLGFAGFSLALSGYCVGAFAALSAAALSRDLSHVRAIPTMPFYWPLSSLAAWYALFELATRPHYWAKTAHGISQRNFLRRNSKTAPSAAAALDRAA